MIQSALNLASPAKDVGQQHIRERSRPSGDATRPDRFALALEREKKEGAPLDGKLPESGKDLPQDGKAMPPASADEQAEPECAMDGQPVPALVNDAAPFRMHPEATVLLVAGNLPVPMPAAVPISSPDTAEASAEPAPETLLQLQSGRQPGARPDNGALPQAVQAAADGHLVQADKQTAQIQAPSAPAQSDNRPGFMLDVARITAEPAAQPAQTSAVPSFHASPMAIRPHEFTSLVDRLVEAREVAGIHKASITVDHADFGAVHLRFEQRDTGLAVAMSSADPDFNRAVSAAAATLPSAPDRDNSQPGTGSNGGNGTRSDNAASNGNGRPSQGAADEWFPNGERTAVEATGPDSNQNNKGRSRKGIFA